MNTATPTRADGRQTAEWLDHIAEMLDAEASGMVALYPDGRHDLIANGLNERAVAEYRDYYNHLDPLPSLLAKRPAGRAIVLDTTTHPAYVAQCELSTGFLRPQGIDHLIAAQWREPGGTLWVVGVLRFHGSAPFTIAQGREFERLIHHWRVGSACPPPAGFDAGNETSRRSRRSCDIAAQLDIPLIAVDTRLAVVWANPAAREACGTAWAVLFDERTKHPAKLAVRRHLQELVLACLRQCSETEAIVTAEDGTWFAAAAPLNGRPGLALLRLTAMHHLGRGLRGRLQRLFGLTTAEAETTVLLANGGSLEAIAEARGVSVDTVRTQLRRVFTKTGIHRQGELVCAVGRLAAG